MQSKIMITAALLALTFVGRAMFEPHSGKAATENKTAQLVTSTQPAKLPKHSNFSEFGGEFQLKLTLQRQGGKWTVIKTDEVTQAEAKQPEQLKAFRAGLSEPDPNTWVTVMSPVREYLYYRKQAVITHDPSKLWARYPQLQQGIDQVKGINTLPWVSSSRNLKPFDGNINPEHYQRIKVKVAGNQAEVIVHGIETYIYSQ